MRYSSVLRMVGAACLGTLTAVSSVVAATSVGDPLTTRNVPRFTQTAPRGTPTEATKTIDVMIWLKLRNRTSLDQLARELYDRESPSYHHWIKSADFETRFAPTANDAAIVKNFFMLNGLAVTEVGPKNMYVRARGTVAQVSRAFHTQLYDFTVKGRTVYANESEPTVAGTAGPLIGAIYGLHNPQYTHPAVTQQHPTVTPTVGGDATNGPRLATASRLSSATAPPINSNCVSGKETETFTNFGSYPYVTLTGNGYATKSGGLGMCGYSPPEIQAAYHLNELYKEGLDGTGQTIVIIDICGSPSILADANTFSAAYGLPPLTAANFKLINFGGHSTCEGVAPQINTEVEWAHAIAPGAHIDLIITATPYGDETDSAEFFAIINNLGNVISGNYANSLGSGNYGNQEAGYTFTELETKNLINEIAAVQGISANFPTGDNADGACYQPDCQGTPNVNAPADTPYATAVGGISLELNSNNSIAWQAGWGTNINGIVYDGGIEDPPENTYLFGYEGSGGGTSVDFAKPRFQADLIGNGRLLPDISWLADYYTGAVVVVSEPFAYPTQVFESMGGTSLACSMFSALWAIANEASGIPLGQAAQSLYSMPASTIFDVVPVGSATNVTASYEESPKKTVGYDADYLAGPLYNSAPYISAIWNYPLSTDKYVLTFGTDTTLMTDTGWDNVTGLGVPNAKAFVEYFSPLYSEKRQVR